MPFSICPKLYPPLLGQMCACALRAAGRWLSTLLNSVREKRLGRREESGGLRHHHHPHTKHQRHHHHIITTLRSNNTAPNLTKIKIKPYPNITAKLKQTDFKLQKNLAESNCPHWTPWYITAIEDRVTLWYNSWLKEINERLNELWKNIEKTFVFCELN